MTYQEFMDLLDEEIFKATKKLIAEHPESEIHVYRRLKERIKSKLEKEAKSHGMAERQT